MLKLDPHQAMQKWDQEGHLEMVRALVPYKGESVHGPNGVVAQWIH